MGASLEALQTLQQVQIKLTALRSKIEARRKQVAVHRRKFAELEKQVTARHDTVMKQRSAIGQVELEIKSREAEVTKLRNALNTSKSNKEYATILTQMNTDKADSSKLEDRVLQMMTELDRLRAEHDLVVSQLEKERQVVLNAEQTAEAFARDSHQELSALEAQRARASEGIPSSVLQVFERACERHEGEALAAVIQPHPKRQEYICDGCNMGVTLEQYLSLLHSRDDMQCCQSCGRILYADLSLARS
ncbi:MAG: hypothetical protein HJJLKODD_01071 [Phycisphaerae bacterium]|nr:hypothetical protein [Phycisphaerae bacterium]